MDFIKDIELIAKTVLDQHGIDYSAVSGWGIIRVFLNFQSKLIRQAPRNVMVSNKIQGSSYDDATKVILAAIEGKFRRGDDVNPHASRGILKGIYSDSLLDDWGIYHFHLNTELDDRDKRFAKRSLNVLFLKISGDTVYFIDIRPHGRNGEPNVFEQKSFLQTIVDEWPWVLDPYKIPGASGMEDEINDAEGVKKMRKKGVSLFHKINGDIYLPPGGGITAAGTSMRVTRRANDLYYLAKDAEKYIIENRSQIDERLSRVENYNPSEAQFRVGLVKDEFLIYEELTREAIVYLEG
jgi:hypothetical protein